MSQLLTLFSRTCPDGVTVSLRHLTSHEWASELARSHGLGGDAEGSAGELCSPAEADSDVGESEDEAVAAWRADLQQQSQVFELKVGPCRERTDGDRLVLDVDYTLGETGDAAGEDVEHADEAFDDMDAMLWDDAVADALDEYSRFLAQVWVAESEGQGRRITFADALSRLVEADRPAALAAHMTMIAQLGLHLRCAQRLSGDSLPADLPALCLACLVATGEHALTLADEIADRAADMAEALACFPLRLLAAPAGDSGLDSE